MPNVILTSQLGLLLFYLESLYPTANENILTCEAIPPSSSTKRNIKKWDATTVHQAIPRLINKHTQKGQLFKTKLELSNCF